MSASLTILLIHGAWMNERCWYGFEARYVAAGHTVVSSTTGTSRRDPSRQPGGDRRYIG